ncbi:hypothetical protein TrVE_jg13319 [Triparma verrucosa]|uniref:Tubby C-terminal domain-containing protein n=1 Tax=Triparma verrucosa TaxID=1606542 RepID=A0A9W7CDS0_9STRA|nr:hypothetical protein TrVE_jg13319 [Triparma verrucosa]
MDLSRPPPLTYLRDPCSVEEGIVREKISNEVVAPGNNVNPKSLNSDEWVNGRFTRLQNKNHFTYTFEDSSLFCLSAMRIGDRFYISQYRHFPKACSKKIEQSEESNEESEAFEYPPSNYIAVLDLDPNVLYGYRLYFAAGRVNYSEVGGEKRSEALNVLETGCRSIVDIKQSIILLPQAKTRVRKLTVSLPPILIHNPDTENAFLAFRGSEADSLWTRYAPEKERMNDMARQWEHYVRPEQRRNTKSNNDGGGDPYAQKKYIISSKIPLWNPDLNSLVVKFDRNRITMASSKNFILYNQSDCNDELVEPEDAIVQFGKTYSRSFSLDFKRPVCALQAFGIALSNFNFSVDQED